MSTRSVPVRPGPPRTLLRVLVAVAIVLALLFLATRFVAEPLRVTSASMTPTFGRGDQLLVRKRLLGGILADAGDVVVFRRPGAEPAAGELMIKRVAAVAGDRVGVRDGRLVVNGVRVREAYVVPAEVDGTYFGPVTVPSGSVFVLGDNRADSVDSRDFGAVPVDHVVGNVLLRLWSAG